MKVHISGYGILSSLGNSPNAMFSSLLENKSAVKVIDEWSVLQGLHCQLGAPVVPYDKSPLPRMARRTMSTMSEMAALASIQALNLAELKISDLDPERALISMGSTTGSPATLQEYFQKLSSNKGPISQSGTAFFKVMNHSVASNVAVALGFSGAVLAPSSACATSAQAAILAWEQIQSGLYDIAICGGADELHFLSSVVFDSVYAASRGYHHAPTTTPRPFDKNRDGLVVSEGASIIILESDRSLKKRNGQSFGEFMSGAYLCESSHMSQSNSQQMSKVMKMALKRAELTHDKIEYVSAHATGTVQGDAQEAAAIGQVFGNQTPVSSLKAHFGHSMAACGVGEIIATLKMMESGILIGTRNLDQVADDCAGVNHFSGTLKKKVSMALSNNFAFGGINTSLIIKGPDVSGEKK
ncbi:MAG: beta-ketoacyl-[acyl-carrier-protein] synthase family protein [Bdellovibrionaceae bacterium]|nr:beta-ketoacyl-[acyl-carrier-protein] synthase family protein [Bdellovibrio sp.]